MARRPSGRQLGDRTLGDIEEANADLSPSIQATLEQARTFKQLSQHVQNRASRVQKRRLQAEEAEFEFQQKQKDLATRQKAREQGTRAGRRFAQQEKPDQAFLPQFVGQEEEKTSIFDRQFRAAAMSGFLSEMEIQGRRRAREFYEQHRNEPEEFQSKFDSYVEGFRRELPSDMVDEFTGTADRIRRHYMNRIRQNHQQITRQSALEDLQPVIDNQQQDIFNYARNALSSDRQMEDLAAEHQHFLETLIRYGPSGAEFTVQGQNFAPSDQRLDVLSAEQISQIYNRTVERSKELLFLGQYDRMPDLPAKQEYVSDLEQDFRFPEDQQMDVDIDEHLNESQQEKVLNALKSRLNSDLQGVQQDFSFWEDQIKEAITNMNNGVPIEETKQTTHIEMIQRIAVQDPAKAKELMQDYRRAQNIQSYTSRIRDMNQTQLQSEVNRLRNELDDPEGDQTFQQQLLDTASQRLKAAKQLSNGNKNPIQYAREVNFQEELFQPLDFPTLQPTPEDATNEETEEIINQNQQELRRFRKGLSDRLRGMAMMSRKYGIPLNKGLGPAEKTALNNFMNDPRTSAQQKLSLMTQFQKALPDRSVNANMRDAGFQMLKDIAGDQPLLAYASGLAAESPQHFENARQMLLGTEPDKTVEMPTDSQFRNTDAMVRLNQALVIPSTEDDPRPQKPNLRTTIFQAAKNIYKRMIPARSDAALTGEIDTDIWTQALHKAAGGINAKETGGFFFGEDKRKGGIQFVRERATIMPPNVGAKGFRTMMNRLGEFANEVEGNPLKFLSPSGNQPVWVKATGKTEPVTPEDLKNESIKFVFAGNNKYRLFVQDLGFIQNGGRADGGYIMDVSPLVDQGFHLPKEPGEDTETVPQRFPGSTRREMMDFGFGERQGPPVNEQSLQRRQPDRRQEEQEEKTMTEEERQQKLEEGFEESENIIDRHMRNKLPESR